MQKTSKNNDCMQNKLRRTTAPRAVHIGSGYTILTQEMRRNIVRHAQLTNPTNTVRMLGYRKNNASGGILNRLKNSQQTIRTHFYRTMAADLARLERRKE